MTADYNGWTDAPEEEREAEWVQGEPCWTRTADGCRYPGWIVGKTATHYLVAPDINGIAPFWWPINATEIR